ncbi:MAG: hypothetical protein ACJAZV_000892 [Roseivirga sp.]|jgi:hypothetical protein
MFRYYFNNRYGKMIDKNGFEAEGFTKESTKINPWPQILRLLAFGLGFILLELINQYFYTEVFDLQSLITKGLRGMLIGVFVLNFNWFWKKIGLGKRG